MTPEDNYNLSDEITNKYSDFETFMFLLIVKDLKVFNGDINYWQKLSIKKRKEFLKKASDELDMLSVYTLKQTSKHIKLIADIESEQIIKDLQKAGFYGKIKGVNTSNIVKNNFNDVNKYINDNVKLDLIKRNQGGKLKSIYTNIVKDVSNSYIRGQLSFEQSLSKIINSYISNGLQSGYIDRAGRKWQIDTYMDGVLRNTYNKVFNDVRTSGMFENGIYTVKMSVVPNCALRCSNCQGRILDMREPENADSGYPSIYNFDYGLAGGTLGCNCRHSIIPYILDDENNKPLKYTAKDEQNYKNTQKQRYYERVLRKKDRYYKVAKELNDKQNIAKYSNQIKATKSKLNDLISKTQNTSRFYERERDRIN